MAYNILGINPFHDGSICLLSDGEIVCYLEEERLSKLKKDSNPFLSILKIVSKCKLDAIVLGGINYITGKEKFIYNQENITRGFLRKILTLTGQPLVPIYETDNYHHDLHALNTFHNSGFKNALGIIIDGGGSKHIVNDKNTKRLKPQQVELHSTFLWENSMLTNINTQYKDYNKRYLDMGIADYYTAITYYLGFKSNEEGKTMGLSSYGNKDQINTESSIFTNYFLKKTKGKIDKKEKHAKKSYKLDSFLYPPLKDFKWHKNPSKLTEDITNLALDTQNKCQEEVGNMIDFYIKKTNQTNVCCSGGYFLNCVSNYYLKKRFPNINFYFDPTSHDGGTAIGAALSLWYDINNYNIPHKPMYSLYLGPQYSKKKLLKGIKKYV